MGDLAVETGVVLFLLLLLGWAGVASFLRIRRAAKLLGVIVIAGLALLWFAACARNASFFGEVQNPFLSAVQAGDVKTAKRLLEQGADPNLDQEGFVALVAAADAGHEDMVALLLARGARVDQRDFDHRTALSAAQARGHTEIVKMLKKAGAEE